MYLLPVLLLASLGDSGFVINLCKVLCLQNELGILPWAIVAINELGMCFCVSRLAGSASLLYLTNIMQEEYFLFLTGNK